VLDLFLGIFGSLALAAAALGIVNTLVMAILERRREIGIMKAVGASDADVKRLFLAEAAVMGLAGGALGVALGWVIGRLIYAGTNFYLRRQNLPSETLWAVSWWLAGGAITFAIVISIISGLYPAARAAKLDPVRPPCGRRATNCAKKQGLNPNLARSRRSSYDPGRPLCRQSLAVTK